jgi:hypothetical protein
MAPNVGADKAFRAMVPATWVQMSGGQSRGMPDRQSDPYFSTRPRTFPSLHKRQRALPPKPDDPMTEAVKHDVEVVIRAWRKYRSTRIRDAVYPFLQQVYDTGLKWKRANRVSEYCRLALELIESPPAHVCGSFRSAPSVCRGIRRAERCEGQKYMV